MWGIVPAAGIGSRIQPLACSKELLPIGSVDEGGVLRPRAVSEYLVDRLVLGGATKIAFVISTAKADMVEYYGAGSETTPVAYVVQPEPHGLCDALFRALPLVRDEEHVLVGLPDTIWFPDGALAELIEEDLSFLCFPVDRPELFDAVDADAAENVLEVQVKDVRARTHWIWGAFKVKGNVLRQLHSLWVERSQSDAYLGTLVNAWLARGGRARARKVGRSYVDVGTIDGYREAVKATGTTSGVARVANGRRAAGATTPRTGS